MFDLPALEADLAGTLFAGSWHFIPVTGSPTPTPSPPRAKVRAWLGFLADEQLAGRGRGDHGWVSVAGEGLYVSVLLRPQIPSRICRFLPLAAGLAAAEAIRAVSGLIVDLRWPNDLLVGRERPAAFLLSQRPNPKVYPT